MTLRRLTIQLEPQDEAVFSRSAATMGAHNTLTGPPGAALLGWAARNCYHKLDEKAQTLVFHSGLVRFSDAVRFEGGQPRFANPAVLFEPKHGSGHTALGRAAFELANPHDRFVQPEAVKGRWLSLDGEGVPRPAVRRRMRTAMHEGKAATGQLFGYQALDPTGLSYRATIESDSPDLTDGDWNEIKAAFDCDTLRLGRARTSGYGGTYRCTLVKDLEPLWPAQVAVSGKSTLRFWFLSDALFLNHWGTPKSGFEAADFGLQTDWKMVASESAISTRRAWPWNATIHCRDVELPLVEAGSVACFAWQGTSQPPQVTPVPLVGAGRQRGLGRVAIIPNGFKFRERDSTGDSGNGAASPEPPDTALVKWVLRRVGQVDQGRQLDWEENRIVEVKDLIQRAGRSGPSPSQWSLLGDLADQLAENGEADWGDRLRDESWRANLVGLDRWVRQRLFAVPEGESHATMRPYIRRIVKAARANAQGARG